MLEGISKTQKIIAVVVAGIAIAGWATAIVFMVRSAGLGEELATAEAELAARAGRISEIEDALKRERAAAGSLTAITKQIEVARKELITVTSQLAAGRKEQVALAAQAQASEAELAKLTPRVAAAREELAVLTPQLGGTPGPKITATTASPKPDFQVPARPATYTTVKNANVRSGPSTDTAKLTTLRKGTNVTVLEKVRGGRWYRVARGGKEFGYIFGKLLKPTAK